MLLKFSQLREVAIQSKQGQVRSVGVLAQESHQALSGWLQVLLIYSSNLFFFSANLFMWI